MYMYKYIYIYIYIAGMCRRKPCPGHACRSPSRLGEIPLSPGIKRGAFKRMRLARRIASRCNFSVIRCAAGSNSTGRETPSRPGYDPLDVIRCAAGSRSTGRDSDLAQEEPAGGDTGGLPPSLCCPLSLACSMAGEVTVLHPPLCWLAVDLLVPFNPERHCPARVLGGAV